MHSIHQFALAVCFFFVLAQNSALASQQRIIFNEIAWMGTTESVHDEWIELHNPTTSEINLTGWRLDAQDGSPAITLSGTIPGGGYFLLERNDNNTVPHISADQLYSGALMNSGEVLLLKNAAGVIVDRVNGWAAGSNRAKATMERISSSGTVQWNTATWQYDVGLGTPRAINSQSLPNSGDTLQQLNQVFNGPGSINVYFNKSAVRSFATANNIANYHVNLEERLLIRIRQAQTSIDMATYEINLPDIISALIHKAADGVSVRIIADAKHPADPEHSARYQTMRLHLEKLVRGFDKQIGTSDDIMVFSDSPIFAVEDVSARQALGLPETPTGLNNTNLTIGNSSVSGFLLIKGETKSNGHYYSPGEQMHNKFVIIDNRWVWTGSWNFTITGLYGSETNRQSGTLGGNSQHAIEINHTKLADAFTTEFNEMWGSNNRQPNPATANFHSRKKDNTPHRFTIAGRDVELYFSPGDDAIGHLTSLVKNNANHSVYFTIFAWSDQALVDALKVKWEGSNADQQGTLTDFSIKGVFDASFWNNWWSVSVDMTGRTATQTSTNNPNTRWANPAPVLKANEARKLHSKTLLIDVCTESDPTVVVGSTNWSNNGNKINDENLLIVHDAAIANQFLQEFYARYQTAGGSLPSQMQCSN